jgi:xanthine/CO dehydrogenase XdhC/CoxF family maturation factor
MLVFRDGRTVGTIGGGCYENDAFGKARLAIDARAPQLVHYELSDDFAQETGLICGGQMDVYIEPIEPSPELYIVGAGHVGFHLARIAQEVGFRVHVATIARNSPTPSGSRPPRKSSSTTSRPGSRRRASRRTPTSSSSRAAIPTISKRCARWRRAICATWGSSAAARRSRGSTTP